MKTLGNVIWLVCGGFFSALAYITGGLSLCLTVIGIPWGIASIKIGLATLAPFGLGIEESRDSGGVLQLVLNLIWFVLWGWVVALHHILWALVLAITIIGLPFAKQHMKLVPLACFPFGKALK